MGSDAESKLLGAGCGVEVVQIPVHVPDSDVQGGARQILAVLRPAWSSENIQFKLFTDGITNKLVGCYHRPSTTSATSATSNGQQRSEAPPADTDDSNSSHSSASSGASLPSSAAADVVLIRVYGNNTELLIDRQAETRNIKMLQRHGFAPNLYAVFQNGLAYEYVPGCTLTPQTVRSPQVWPLVARHMAKMHRLAVRGATSGSGVASTGGGLGESAEPMLASKMRSFLDLVPERFADEAKETRLRSLGLPTVQTLRADFESLYSRLRRLGSPVVFAHNDLLLGNVIYEEAASRVAFIDYEYAAHNYQAFDIGNHFTEFAGIDSIDYTLYPNEPFQLQWLRVYLAAYKAEQVAAPDRLTPAADVDEKEVRRMYGQVNAFALASHYFWTVWGLIQVEHSTIQFDFVEFAMMRYNEYLVRKDEFLALIE